MACYFLQNSDTDVSITRYVQSSAGVTYYEIKVRVKNVEWLVDRRYRDFYQMNEKLIEEIALSRKLLPPKKIVGNKNPTFLEQRREQLEKYLKEILVFFRIQLPRVVAEFLDFNKYDIIYLLQDLANLFSENGDGILNERNEFSLTALEVYAISERLGLPCPPENIEQRGKFSFSHVLDFCTRLETLIIIPVKTPSGKVKDYNTVDVPIGRSNIIPKSLFFNLNAFRNLKTLKFFGISMENIVDIAVQKPTLSSICVHNTTITHINQVLMCDNVHKDIVAIPTVYSSSISISSAKDCPTATNVSLPGNNKKILLGIWQQLEELDLTGNLLTQIDTSIRTASQLRSLVLDQNRIKNIQNLADLPHLQVLSLSVNLISECNDWHLQLGNLVTLNLAQNKLSSLSGLRKLLSLVNLDLSCNQIEQLEEIDYVACLPILETLRLTGNPLASSVDYRARVLARFHERACEIILDSEPGSQRELDTALVLSALHKSKSRQKLKKQL